MMPEPVQNSPESLDAVLAALLEMSEQGQAADRKAWMSRYPQFAAELEEFFTSREHLEPWAAPLRSVARALVPTPRPEESPTPGERPDGPVPAAPDRFPHSLPDYELLSEIGRGGMGVVYKARQKSLNRLVAVKLIRAGGLAPEDDLRRFRNEAEAVAHLDHAHIVAVHEVGEHAGQHYFTMKLIEGGSLDRQLARFSAEPKATARLLAAVARAVHHAHQRGILHRDLKPGNVLVDAAGQPHVTDFGLAKRVEVDSSLTQSGVLIGTPSYMAPEQTSGVRGAITTATDVYGLGAVLYAMLTGQPPFRGDHVLETLRQVREQEPQSPSAVNPRVDRDLATITLKCLRKEPEQRYASAEELAADLDRYVAGEPIQARPIGRATRLWRWCRRHQTLTAAAAAALVMGIAVLGASFGWVARDGAARRTETERVVAAALDESASWQEQRRLPETLSAARRANGLLAGAYVDESLRQQVQARLADLELLERLENVRLEKQTAVKDGHFDWLGADDLYGQTFRDAGLDVDTLPVEEAVERFRRSTVAVELAAMLDQWAMVRWNSRGLNDPSWKPLLRIARLADADAVRARVRESLERRDTQALLSLASSEEVLRLPVATLYVLSSAVPRDEKARGQVEAFLRRAQRQHPNDFWLNHILFMHFKPTRSPSRQEAIRFASVAVALRPESPGAHFNLGAALKDNGKADEAIAEYHEAIRLKKDYAEAHRNLGYALWEQGKVDEGIAQYREAIHIKNDDSAAHNNLGVALWSKGQVDEAIDECREAIRINEGNAEAHNSLAVALADKGRLDEVITEYEKAIRLKKDFPQALNNLAIARQWKAAAEKLPSILKGEAQPADAADRIGLALFCQLPFKRLYATSARFYGQAFAAQPTLANNLSKGNRYNAACAAALAGCGQGKDADQSDDKERARLRRQALDWLRADLTAWRNLLEKDKAKWDTVVLQQMQHWLGDTDFNGVRGTAALAKLPQAERGDWQRLWEEVAALRQRAQPKEK